MIKPILYLYLLFLLITSHYAQVTSNWISFYNSNGNRIETINDIYFDTNGNTYLTGKASTAAADYDYITIKYNSSGEEQWAKTYDGPINKFDEARAIYVDAAGITYVTGMSEWFDGNYNIVTIKYSPTGEQLWVSAYDSTNTVNCTVNDITVDIDGNAYITGNVMPVIGSSFGDIFTLKLASDGRIMATNNYGQVTDQYDIGSDIISDNSGFIYTAGNSFNITNGEEAVIIKLSNTLDTLWTVHINGSDPSLNEFTTAISVDDTGNVYALCRIQTQSEGTNFAIVKISPSGEIIWQNEFDESGGQDISEAMVLDSDGNIFVTGRVRRPEGFGHNDFGIIKYLNSGERDWVSYYNGPNNLDDDPLAITTDSNGNIYVCGESNRDGSNFKFTVVKYRADGTMEWDYTYGEGEIISSKAIGVWVDNNGLVYAGGETDTPNRSYDLMALRLEYTTGISNEENGITTFRLEQNYPNPFNPSTKIKFSIPESEGITSLELVTLKVYSILGEEIMTLLSEQKTAGEYELTFDGTGLSSGIYIYVLHTGNKTISRRMTLLK